MAQASSEFRSQNYDSTEIDINHRVGDEFEQFGKGSLLGDTEPQSDNDHGCLLARMGSPWQWQVGSGPLDLTTGQDAFNSHVLYQQIRWYQVDSPMQQSLGHDVMVLETWHSPAGDSCAGQRQCFWQITCPDIYIHL